VSDKSRSPSLCDRCARTRRVRRKARLTVYTGNRRISQSRAQPSGLEGRRENTDFDPIKNRASIGLSADADSDEMWFINGGDREDQGP